MKINISELMPIQRDVNKEVRKKLERDVRPEEFILAFNIELFEYFNAIGTWKWWKHSHSFDKEKILDELADCFAFFLSVIDLEHKLSLQEGVDDFIDKVNYNLNEIFNSIGALKAKEKSNKVIINDLIAYVGTDNEMKQVQTIERFAIAIFIVSILFEDVTWEEITNAYKEKSKVNIQRQVEDY